MFSIFNLKKTKYISIFLLITLFTLGIFFLTQSTQAKPSSKASKEGVFNPKFDWFYLRTSNDITVYMGKMFSKLPTIRYEKGKDHLQFSMTGISYSNLQPKIQPISSRLLNIPSLFNLPPTTHNLQPKIQPISSTTAVTLETNVKTPNEPVLFYRGVDKDIDVIYKISNIPLKVKEEIVLQSKISNLKSKNLSFVFDATTTAKPVKQSDGSIAFFDDKGDYLFQLDKPFMIDANLNRSEAVTIEIIPKSKVLISNKIPSLNNQFFKQFKKFFPVWDLKNWNLFSPPEAEEIRNSKPTEYQIILKASSNWLNDPSRVYPVVIDPTVTHNADANFTGQMNRIADSDTTTSTQLESSYPEATKDPYTVLLLHFNEANGTTAGIRDYASTTRVITANGNASTTSYVTQLGLGNSAAFDGTGDYLSLADSDDFDLGTGNFSMEAWVNTPSVPSVSRIISQGDVEINNGDWTLGYGTIWGGGTKINFAIRSGGVLYDYISSPITININTWHHIALTRSGSTLYYFIDGVPAGTSISSYALTSSQIVYVGARKKPAGVTEFQNGYLDELHILKGRALTPEEIKASASRRPYSVYTSSVLDASASVKWDTLNWTEGGVNTGLSAGAGNGEQPYSTNSLVAQWDFNDTSGTTLTASSSGSCTTACNGTLTNFASTASQDQAAGTGWTANNKKWGAGGLMISGVATADLVSISDPASNVLDPNSADLTIETWVKTSDVSAEIFSNNNANGAACTNNGYYLGIDSSGYLVFNLDTNGATAGCDAAITGSAKINDGFWHFLSISVTRGTSAIMYLDGVQIGSDTSVTSYSAIIVTGNAYFGGSAGGLDAIIDSTHIYSRALSASEILSNYNAGNIEIQTRTGATSDPNDGTWEAWKPATSETQLLSMDSDSANWSTASTATIAVSNEANIKTEGTGSLKIQTGAPKTDANTVALWHMEETSGSGAYIKDATANANNATPTGTTVVDGIFGKARKFNGTGNYLRVPDSEDFEFGSGDFSIDFWAYPYDVGGATLISKTGGVDHSPYIFRLLGGSWNFLSATGNSSWDIANFNFGTAIVNQWQHIAATRTVNDIKFYINGQYQTMFTTVSSLWNNTHALDIGYGVNGIIDEVRFIKGRALSPDEIAETYRMGANHHLTRQVSAVDLSAQTKLAFWIAADRPGTGLEAMLGESDYANYELASSTLALSTNTVLYIKGDEIASSTSIKDSSFSGKAITANGNARTAGGGKIGNSVYFDGTGDRLSLANSVDFQYGTGDYSMDMWVYHTSLTDQHTYIADTYGAGAGVYLYKTSTAEGNKLALYYSSQIAAGGVISVNKWQHIAVSRTNGQVSLFLDGVLVAGASDTTNLTDQVLAIGSSPGNEDGMNGYLDEIRISKGTALTPDQIRQAYEYGLRTHPITIDFGATLQTSDLISSATDYNFNITATTSGLSATTSGLYLGDKIIIKENLGGTEYTTQGTVNSINTATGAITVPSWDTGSTFPSGNGYSPNATVFKWQREYFDLGGAATTTRDAITNLTLRPTNGAEGRTIYLDDFKYNTNYLTASSSSAITSSNGRYLQYRAIFTSTDSFVSPFLSAFNTLYTSLSDMFPAGVGISGDGFLIF